MNTIFEKLTSATDDPISGDASVGNDAQEPTAVAISGNERDLNLMTSTSQGKVRVLLLEDDPYFREIVGGYLAANGFSVVAVQNGGEGIREVLTGDFALVVCDVMMPNLSGDMFYRAVERICPALCKRFIFITGYRKSQGFNEFINSINGTVLRKPFSLKNLLEEMSANAVSKNS